jgi:hypothetical protein
VWCGALGEESSALFLRRQQRAVVVNDEAHRAVVAEAVRWQTITATAKSMSQYSQGRKRKNVLRSMHAGKTNPQSLCAKQCNDPPAEPEAFRLLAPQRGLIATDQRQERAPPHSRLRVSN